MNQKLKEEFEALLKKYNVKIGIKVTFPIYNIIPDEVKLALKVLEKHNVQYQVSLEGVKDANQK